MTKQERVIVTAYTGVLMCKLSDLLKYANTVFGRTVYLAELKKPEVLQRLKDFAKVDFKKLCEGESIQYDTDKASEYTSLGD